jgi:CDGSH-type Zn-finger protein
MTNEDKPKIKITKNGPYLVSGNVPLSEETADADAEGYPEKWMETKKFKDQTEYLLCRCGQSKNKPYCDSSHLRVGFNGKENAGFKTYNELAKKFAGPELDLLDAKKLCSIARFCTRAAGTWNLTMYSDNEEARNLAIEQAGNCPSGRLVIYDKKTGQPIEPKLAPSIAITQDPTAKVSGPIWARGGIEMESADGRGYEKRNRVTLCRCGHSKNKPFCDGSHVDIGFNDKS